jgi:hypothetical protein
MKDLPLALLLLGVGIMLCAGAAIASFGTL